MVEVDSAVTEQRCYRSETGLFPIHVVLAGIVFKGTSGDNQLGIWYYFIFSARQVHDLLKMDLNFTVGEIGEGSGIVDQSGYFALAHLAGTEPEHEEQ